jgi:hypothetical protein
MSNGHATSDHDLPWLEEVEDEDGPRGFSAGKMLAALLVVLVAAGIVAGTFFWLGRSDPADGGGPPELIRAPEGPYKIKPADPGGLDVAGESETAFETSAGQDVDAQLDTSGMPQAQFPQPEPKKIPPGETKAPVAAEPAPAPSGGSGTTIQLGAYRNTAQAERAWSALSARFPNLSGLSKIVVPYSAGGSSGFRLRAGASSSAEAQQVCRALQAAGESCFVAR